MKRIFKTLIAFITAIVICMNSAMIVSAEGETSGTCGDGVTWSYDSATSELTVEGNGAMDDYTRDSYPWYSYKSNINSVNIGEGVTRIGKNSFNGCLLKTIMISNTVLSIGEDAFCDSSLQSVDIPSSVKTIEYGAFRSSSLKSVILNEGLETIGPAAFYGSKVSTMSPIPESVKSIEVSAFKAMGGANTGHIDEITLLCTDCSFPTESGTFYDVFYNSSHQPDVRFVYSQTTEDYLKRVEHTKYTVLCKDGTENHTFEKTSTTATCTEAGKKTMTCSVCGATKEEDEDALGHSFTNYVSDGNATCTADGTKTAQCDNGCGEKDTVSDENSALGHSFTNYVSDGNATCTADGTKTAVCDNGCGEKDTVTDEGSKTEHMYEEVTIAPTCTEQGYTEYKCKDCGDTYKSDYVDALGHTPETVIVKEAQIGVAGLQQEKCSVCGEILSETQIPALEEPTTQAETTTEKATTVKADTTEKKEADNSFKTDYSRFRVVGGIECAKVAIQFDEEISGYEVFVSDGSGFKNRGEIKDKKENYLVLLNLKSDCNYLFKLKAYKTTEGKRVYADKESKTIFIRIE